MIDISKFVRERAPLCICTLGVAILGYLGYHAVRWIINKCHKTEKIDSAAQRAIGSALSEMISLSNSQGANPHNSLPQITGSKRVEEMQVEEIALRQKGERETAAAEKIQSAYRGHIARVALQKLQVERLEKQQPADALNTPLSDNLSLRSTNSTLMSKRVCPTILEDNNSKDNSNYKSDSSLSLHSTNLRSTNSTLKSKWVCPMILEDNNLDECKTIKRILDGKFRLAHVGITICNDNMLKKAFNIGIVLFMLDLKPHADNMVNNTEIEKMTQSLIIQLKKFDAPEMALEINEAIEYLNYIPQILSSDRPGFSIC